MSDIPSMASGSTETQARDFWILMAYAVVLGVVGVASGLLFLGVTGIGEDWYGDTGTGWFEGHWWWVAVAAAAGLIVGILRHVLKMPAKTPGLIEDLKTEHIDVNRVPAIVAVSAVSLIGGASLGPEVALGQMGGGTAGWIAKHRNLDDDATKTLTLTGMAGAFGGLFSSPFLTMMLVLEIAKPAGKRFLKAFYGTLVASSVSFGIYFAIAGTVFFGVYDVPAYTYEDWHLLAGVALGVLAAGVAVLALFIGSAFTKAFSRFVVPDVAKPVIGAVIFGLIGVALPLTNFTGSGQLATVLDNAGTLGLGLLIAILIGKMIAFAASSASGFIGGPIFPILFLGGTAGIIVNQVFPDIPLGLAFACMLAAVPGSIVAAPFSMVLLTGLVAQMGTLQTAPVLLAVGSAYLTIAGARYVLSHRSLPAAPPADQQ